MDLDWTVQQPIVDMSSFLHCDHYMRVQLTPTIMEDANKNSIPIILNYKFMQGVYYIINLRKLRVYMLIVDVASRVPFIVLLDLKPQVKYAK